MSTATDSTDRRDAETLTAVNELGFKEDPQNPLLGGSGAFIGADGSVLEIRYFSEKDVRWSLETPDGEEVRGMGVGANLDTMVRYVKRVRSMTRYALYRSRPARRAEFIAPFDTLREVNAFVLSQEELQGTQLVLVDRVEGNGMLESAEECEEGIDWVTYGTVLETLGFEEATC